MIQPNNNDNNGGGATAKGSHPACASCKHQRKKCGADCVLAPYFPAEKTREFQAVHKLFGVSNVSKLIKNVHRDQRRAAAESLIWEASCRQNDPVLGSYGEYRKVEEQLKLCKKQNQTLSQSINAVPKIQQLPPPQLPPQAQAGMMQKPVTVPAFVWNGCSGDSMNNMVNNMGGVVAGNNNNHNNNNMGNYNDHGSLDSYDNYSYYVQQAQQRPRQHHHHHDQRQQPPPDEAESFFINPGPGGYGPINDKTSWEDQVQ